MLVRAAGEHLLTARWASSPNQRHGPHSIDAFARPALSMLYIGRQPAPMHSPAVACHGGAASPQHHGPHANSSASCANDFIAIDASARPALSMLPIGRPPAPMYSPAVACHGATPPHDTTGRTRMTPLATRIASHSDEEAFSPPHGTMAARPWRHTTLPIFSSRICLYPQRHACVVRVINALDVVFTADNPHCKRNRGRFHATSPWHRGPSPHDATHDQGCSGPPRPARNLRDRCSRYK